jgi:hypothetical protein
MLGVAGKAAIIDLLQTRVAVRDVSVTSRPVQRAGPSTLTDQLLFQIPGQGAETLPWKTDRSNRELPCRNGTREYGNR